MARPPKTFASFVGQARIVETLRELADGARSNGRTIPHLLLVAAAGLGKTSLAMALARYAANLEDDVEPANLHVVHAGRGAMLQLHRVLREAKTGDFLFIDEAHALVRQDAELLYIAMDRQQTLHLGDDGRLDRTTFEPIASVTIVLATNLPGCLPKALRSRSVVLELDAYTEPELRAIVQRVAVHHEVDLTPQARRVIAKRANGTPRHIEHMLTLVASLTPPSKQVNQSQVEGVLAKALGHDEHGFTPTQRRLLRLLVPAAMRAEQIANHLGVDGGYIRSDVEAPLIAAGLVVVTGNHMRQLTTAGRAQALLTTEKQMREAYEDKHEHEGEHSAAAASANVVEVVAAAADDAATEPADEVEAVAAAATTPAESPNEVDADADDPEDEDEAPPENSKRNTGTIAGSSSGQRPNVPERVQEQISRLTSKMRTVATVLYGANLTASQMLAAARQLGEMLDVEEADAAKLLANAAKNGLIKSLDGELYTYTGAVEGAPRLGQSTGMRSRPSKVL